MKGMFMFVSGCAIALAGFGYSAMAVVGLI
jgi:hypothetical protein